MTSTTWRPIAPREDPLIVNDGRPVWMLWEDHDVSLSWNGEIHETAVIAWAPANIPEPPEAGR